MMEVQITGKNFKTKSKLMTPDPYHTPGYGGFCPQFKYQYGDTFGHTTCNLLRDKNVATSGNLVLTPIDANEVPQDEMRKKSEKLKFRTHSWGDQKLLDKMVPGYTGFIPKREHFFGKRYAENCVNATTSFEEDQKKFENKKQEMRAINDLQTGKPAEQVASYYKPLPEILTHYKLPLQAMTREAKQFVSKSTPPPALSPYSLGLEDPEKRFKSGYTGFIPLSRGLYGLGFPVSSNKALVDFAKVVAHQKQIKKEPVKIDRILFNGGQSPSIYPIDSGLVPKYAGHVPGEKFRYGQTYGHSTVNATLQKIPIQ